VMLKEKFPTFSPVLSLIDLEAILPRSLRGFQG
jgi:hypothetical protein